MYKLALRGGSNKRLIKCYSSTVSSSGLFNTGFPNRTTRRYAFSTSSTNAKQVSSEEVRYKHPLSELVLDEIVALTPEWFQEDNVEWNGADGTFKLPFEINKESGVITTFYDLDAKIKQYQG